MTVPMGTTVTWTDKSDTAHTVTSDTGAFGSSPVQPNQTFRFTFSQAGSFAYHCSIHPYMHGTIVVTAAAQATTATTSTAMPAATASSAAAPTPAAAPARLPSTGAGGMAATGAGAGLAALLVAATGLVGALRRRR
jgi:LPXTG-motif cell wall-anchored protein